jgi:ABC-type phosphate/phosphonate transport system substrate-binding protein
VTSGPANARPAATRRTIAALPMYDWPEVAPATEAFWTAVAAHLAADGVDAPGTLSRPDEPAEAWRDPDLLIGQACGMPYVSGLCGEARVIARPDYGLADAADGLYRSVIVARKDGGSGEGPAALLAHAGGRVAVNEWPSFSGHVVLRAHVAALRQDAAQPFFAGAVLSGSHRGSARMVARAEAEVAALDAVAWALLEAHEPETAGRLVVIDRTAPAPALPFVSAPRFAPLAGRLVRALDAAAADLPAAIGVPRRIFAACGEDYAPVRERARQAAREPFAPGAASVPAL